MLLVESCARRLLVNANTPAPPVRLSAASTPVIVFNQLGLTAPASLHYWCFWNLPELVERQMNRIAPELLVVFCQ